MTFGSLYAPRHGTAVRGRVTVEALAELGVPVTVLSSGESVPAEDRGSLPGVREFRALRHELHFGWSPELVRECRALSRGTDVLLLGSAMLLPAAMMAAPSLPIVWDANECESLHYERLRNTGRARVYRWVWRAIERAAVARSSAVVTVSDTEAAHWIRLFPRVEGKLHVVTHIPLPPGSTPAGQANRTGPELRESGPVVVFVGALGAKHNLAAANWLLLHLAPWLPDNGTLVLAGPGTDALTIPVISGRVRALGEVPDVDAVIRSADLCVAPLAAGAGVKTKMLQYVAGGRRIVCTPLAAEGVESAPGVCVTTLDAFTDTVLSLLAEEEFPEARHNREAAQSAWLRKYHGSAQVATQWAQVLETVVDTSPRRSNGSRIRRGRPLRDGGR